MLLQYPDDKLRNLCESKLLAYAQSWPSVERQIRPVLWPPRSPSALCKGAWIRSVLASSIVKLF